MPWEKSEIRVQSVLGSVKVLFDFRKNCLYVGGGLQG